MIELRWLERKRKGIPHSPKVRVRQTERVLQYRTGRPVTAGPFWSEWRDVPIETEGGSK